MKYVYKLKSSSKEVNKWLIRSSIHPEDMKKLIFYIQYKYGKILPNQRLSKDDIENILEKCYDIEKVLNVKIDEIIDLNLHFSPETEKDIIKNQSKYEVNGLAHELRKIVDLTIEMWR